MAVELTVKEVAEKEGIKSAYELSNKAAIPLASAYRLWNGTARMIGLDTIDRLCNTLHVKPGQLFKHEREEA